MSDWSSAGDLADLRADAAKHGVTDAMVALSSGSGGVEVARVDAQLAMQQWLDARERCAG